MIVSNFRFHPAPKIVEHAADDHVCRGISFENISVRKKKSFQMGALWFGFEKRKIRGVVLLGSLGKIRGARKTQVGKPPANISDIPALDHGQPRTRGFDLAL